MTLIEAIKAPPFGETIQEHSPSRGCNHSTSTEDQRGQY